MKGPCKLQSQPPANSQKLIQELSGGSTSTTLIPAPTARFAPPVSTQKNPSHPPALQRGDGAAPARAQMLWQTQGDEADPSWELEMSLDPDPRVPGLG